MASTFNNSSSIHQRIKQLVDRFANGKNTLFAQQIGVSESNIRSYIKGVMPKADILEKIASSCDINATWLLTGEGDMLHAATTPQANAQLLGVAIPAITEDTIPVRFFDPNPSATFREFCVGMNETPDTINVLPEWNDKIDEQSCVFQVSGESMAPQIQDKAKVLCREVIPSRWFSLRHGIIAIVYDDRFVIKRIKKNYLETQNYILLSSDNPEYPDTEKAYLGSIRCIFEVIRVISQRVY